MMLELVRISQRSLHCEGCSNWKLTALGLEGFNVALNSKFRCLNINIQALLLGNVHDTTLVLVWIMQERIRMC